MMRHLSDDDLARYTEGDLRPRRAAKVGSHLAVCDGCQDRATALRAVPNLLASVQFPAIPAHLSHRIEMALAAESSSRVAREPASEAGRRDLPARARRGRHGRRMPVLNSPLALRTVAGVGAALVVAGGGYEIAAHVGQGGASSTSSISTPPASASVQAGASVSYRHAGHTDSIKTVRSGTNFKPATLTSQAARVLAAQGKSASGPASHATGSPNSGGGVSSTTNLPLNTTAPTTPSVSMLQGCVDRIAAGRNVLLVDIATYQRTPATIIMVGTGGGRAEVYAVGSGCSSRASDILAQQGLRRI
jgi:hypothetical protein